MRRRLAWSVLVALSGALLPSAPTRAQTLEELEELALSGLDARPQEREAWAYVEARKYIRGRELAEGILAAHPDSFVAHLCLGTVQHYAEANFPRAVFHLERARELFEARFGSEPQPDQPWRWHATLLKGLANAHGDLEEHELKLAYIARFNELYEPDMVAQRAWPLMKLGHFEEARLAAQLGLMNEERPAQRTIALNALCAIEFEAGNDGASYEACQRAVLDSRERGMPVSTVDLTNFAEASRSMFKLDEAERIGLEATQAAVSWYGNPWMELAELYTRQARFAEALAALRKVPEYRRQRPPHAREADSNEVRRAVAAFLLAVARPDAALEITQRALVRPDRRAHNSRDAAQDRLLVALLDRRARRMQAQMELEQAAVGPWWKWPWGAVKSLWQQVGAFRSGAAAERLLADEERLLGIFRIGTARAAIMPPWLIGELVGVLGPGVVAEVVRQARAQDKRGGAPAYYAALLAEVQLRAGNPAEAQVQADAALRGLGPAERLLRARVHAIAGEAAAQRGQLEVAKGHYDTAFQDDPGVFRRLELSIPVRVSTSGDDMAERVARDLLVSPRFHGADLGLVLKIEADRAGGRACLSTAKGALLACGEAFARSNQHAREVAAAIARAAQEEIFSPRVDLSQVDINSLDGGNLSGRGRATLDQLIGL